MNFTNLETFTNVFLHFLSWPGFYIIDGLNCKSFLTNYAKEGNSQTFLLQMIPNIRYPYALTLCN